MRPMIQKYPRSRRQTIRSLVKLIFGAQAAGIAQSLGFSSAVDAGGNVILNGNIGAASALGIFEVNSGNGLGDHSE